MPKTAMIFNGIKFPFAVIDQCFNWAKESGCSIVAVYLLSSTEVSEGYGFPSDIDAVNDTSDDVETTSGTADVISSNILMLRNRAALEHISFNDIVLKDPTEDRLSDSVNDCEYIFFAENQDDPVVAEIGFNLKTWSAGFNGSVIVL